MTDVPPPESPKLRIGDRVRCTALDDPFVECGTEGQVVNTSPPRPNSPARARILFDNDTACVMDGTDFEVILTPPQVRVQPTVMAPFPGSAA